MVETSAKIHNSKGIHVRPSGLIFKAIMNYGGEILIIKDGVTTPLRDIISILTLGLAYNDEITIRVSGVNEEEMIDILKDLFEKDYRFEEQ
ncbi:HPr family phosphocarrier protein [Thiospirochaeta perfilievii]|nr:HPr family phosphocarrier protein [Thiospirochaeta perfilievii]